VHLNRPRLLVLLGTQSWSDWIGPFLETEDFEVECRSSLEAADCSGHRDATVFLSSHESLRRDLRLAETLPGPVFHQPEAVVRLAMDKRAMGRRAERVEGIHAIPDLTPGMARELLGRGLVSAIVAKPPDGTAGEGMRMFYRAADLATTGTRLYEGDFLLQPYLEGEELSVNSAWHAGACRFYPPVAKGSTRERLHPSLRTRTCPAPLLHEQAWNHLCRACVAYMRPFEPEGFVEFEFLSREGRFFLLEINPRLSATLRMTAVAASSSPFLDLLGAAVGVRLLAGRADARRWSKEWATPAHLSPASRRRLAAQRDAWVSTRITIAADTKAELERRYLMRRAGM